MAKMKIARPAARKSSGRNNKPAKGASARQSRKPEPPQAVVPPQNPRRRIVELPKVAGELPTPTATFYF